MKRVSFDTKHPTIATAVDWIAVWLILFISVGLSTYVIDPSNFEVTDKGQLITRASILSSSVTIFYMAATWLRRSNSTVPGDILDRLPNDVPEGIINNENIKASD